MNEFDAAARKAWKKSGLHGNSNPNLRDAGAGQGSILIFSNGPSSSWSSKHIIMLGWVCGLLDCCWT